MKHEILNGGATLQIIANREDRTFMRREKRKAEKHGRSYGTNSDEAEALQYLIANSELMWINPADTGDLTSAPMLGIWGHETTREKKGPFGAVLIGGDENGEDYAPIVARWAYMNYQVRSFLDDLIETGHADFVSE